MSADLFQQLEERIVALIHSLGELKQENAQLRQENDRLNEERGGLKSRIDSIVKKLEGV